MVTKNGKTSAKALDNKNVKQTYLGVVANRNEPKPTPDRKSPAEYNKAHGRSADASTKGSAGPSTGSKELRPKGGKGAIPPYFA